jgi:hypothetical protein
MILNDDIPSSLRSMTGSESSSSIKNGTVGSWMRPFLLVCFSLRGASRGCLLEEGPAATGVGGHGSLRTEGVGNGCTASLPVVCLKYVFQCTCLGLPAFLCRQEAQSQKNVFDPSSSWCIPASV